MVAHMRIFAIFLLISLHLRRNHGRIFTVHHDGKLALLEDGAQRGTIFHLQFASAAAHEEFNACHQSRIHVFQARCIVGSCSQEETKIDKTLLLCYFYLLQ